MCGIAGTYGSNTLTPEEITSLLVRLQTRGTDATGMAWMAGDKVRVLKGPAPADLFVLTRSYQEVIAEVSQAKWAMFHCRHATHGNPENNDNNHPITNEGGVLVHNGVVHPETWLTEAKGECDSEQLLLYLLKYGWKGLSKLTGSLAFAYCDMAQADSLYLYAHVHQIVMAENRMVWASTKSILGEPGEELKSETVFRVSSKEIREVTTVQPKAEIKEASRWWIELKFWDTARRYSRW